MLKITLNHIMGILALAFIIATHANANELHEDQPIYLSLTLAEVLSDSFPLTQLYLQQMYSSTDSIFSKEFEEEFLLILNNDQKKYYENLIVPSAKRDFINYYWNANDPNPILDQNDFLLGHIRRCAYARFHFSTGSFYKIDDRGKYYIKYGKPHARFVDSGGMKRIALFTPGVYERIKRFYSMKGAPPQNYTVPANETWSYENISADFVVHFVSGVRGYKEVKSLSEILTSRKFANMAWQWSDLIKQRAPISAALSEAAVEISAFEDQILLDALSRNTSGERVSKGAADDKMIQHLTTSHNVILRARNHVPVFSYSPIHASRQVTFSHNVSQFRGVDGHTRVEVFYLSPLLNNLITVNKDTVTESVSLEFSAMIRNRLHNPIARTSNNSKGPIDLYEKENLANAIGSLTLEAKPQTSELMMQIRNISQNQIGFTRLDLDIRDFTSQNLMISDVQFYMLIEDQILTEILPTVEKQDFVLYPYPFQKIKKSKIVYCYFEIYNLVLSGISESYELTYQITSRNEDKGIFRKLTRLLRGKENISISMQHQQIASEDYVEELIGLDLSNLANGKHLLEIQISDKADSTLTAKISREINITN